MCKKMLLKVSTNREINWEFLKRKGENTKIKRTPSEATKVEEKAKRTRCKGHEKRIRREILALRRKITCPMLAS